MNSVTLLGRITQDIKVNITKTNVLFVRNILAVDNPYNNSKPDFINIVAWRNQAEYFQKYLKKGNEILITGTLKSSQFTDKNKLKRTTHTVHIEYIKTLEKKFVPQVKSKYEETIDLESSNTNVGYEKTFDDEEED